MSCRAWGEINTKSIQFIQQHLYPTAEYRSAGIWNLHLRRLIWSLTPAVYDQVVNFAQLLSPQILNQQAAGCSAPSLAEVPMSSPHCDCLQIPCLGVALRCNSDFALLCWNSMGLIADLKCTAYMVNVDLCTNPACPSLLNSILLAHGFFGLLELSAVPWGFQSCTFCIFCHWSVCIPC